ncbi:MAG: hypothetical protein LQ343_003612 [Gyalolechia ehrenbergii]|nr:MAG: hypothetical protein LQ343_003612 [Gyalolechia ehrenbergii]
MDLQGSFVPPEVLLTIIKLLPCEDIRSLRKVCTILNAYSTPYAIRRIYLSAHWRDRENMTRISQHPVLSRFIEEIVYDSTNCEEHLTDLDAYKDLFGAGTLRQQDGQSYTEMSVIRGHAFYHGICSEQASLREYRGPHLTRPMDDSVRPPNFEAMLYSPHFFSQVMEYLPDDLVRLVRALPRMPRVSQITLSDCRWTTHPDRCQILQDWKDSLGRPSTFSIHNKGRRGLEAAVLNPRPWPEITEEFNPAFDRDWYRGFRVITQALAMTRNHGVTHLGIERDGFASGLSWTMLQLSPPETVMLSSAFRNLKVIVLKIDTTSPPNNGQFANGNPCLAAALASAHSLEHLTIHFDRQDYFGEPYVTSFDGLVGYRYWPHLQSVSFANIVFPKRDVLLFLARHRFKLEALVLDRVFLATSRPNESERDNTYQWKDIFRFMASRMLALQSLTVYTDPAYDWTNPRFHACNAKDVQKLLESGGEDPPSVSCSHDIEYRQARLTLLSCFA